MSKAESANIQPIQLPIGVIKNYKVIIASGLLFVFFFLPWFEIQFLSVSMIKLSGWDLTKIIADIKDLNPPNNNGLITNNQFTKTNIIYVLYIIPAVSILLVYSGFSNYKKLIKYLEFLIVGSILFFSYTFSYNNDIEFKNLGIGALGTIACCLFFLFNGVKKITSENAAIGAKQINDDISSSSLTANNLGSKDLKKHEHFLKTNPVEENNPDVEMINLNLPKTESQSSSFTASDAVSKVLMILFLFCILYAIFNSI